MSNCSICGAVPRGWHHLYKQPSLLLQLETGSNSWIKREQTKCSVDSASDQLFPLKLVLAIFIFSHTACNYISLMVPLNHMQLPAGLNNSISGIISLRLLEIEGRLVSGDYSTREIIPNFQTSVALFSSTNTSDYPVAWMSHKGGLFSAGWLFQKEMSFDLILM